MEEMKNTGGLARYEKQLINDISTCIIRCEKCIYGIIPLSGKMKYQSTQKGSFNGMIKKGRE